MLKGTGALALNRPIVKVQVEELNDDVEKDFKIFVAERCILFVFGSQVQLLRGNCLRMAEKKVFRCIFSSFPRISIESSQ